MRLVDASTAATNRPITNIAYTLRAGSATGSTLLALTGDPNAAAIEADVTGTYGNPDIDRTAYGITGVVHVTQTITDEVGDTATYAEARDET